MREGLQMTRGIKVLLAIAAVIALVILSWRATYPTYVWNQKLTLEIGTPHGPVSASSVVEVTADFEPAVLPEAHSLFFSWRGEAVVADLGNGRFLFALLGSPVAQAQYTWQDVYDAVEKKPDNRGFSRFAKALVKRDDVRPMARKAYPTLVTFDDIDDPATVKRVDPDDMDAALGLCPDGSGLQDANAPWRALDLTWRQWARWQASELSLEDYRRRGNLPPALTAKIDRDAPASRDTSADCHRLTSITLEITDEKVTEGEVERVLGWIRDPSVMENPGWGKLPLESRRAIGGLLSYFPDLKGEE